MIRPPTAAITIRRYEETRGWPDLIAFWVASAMGFLSHLTFLHAYAAILVWSVYAGSTRAGRTREAIVTIVAAHAVPLCFLATLYLVYIRHLRVAGAEFARWPSVIAETSARGAHTRITAARAGAAKRPCLRFRLRAATRGERSRRSGPSPTFVTMSI